MQRCPACNARLGKATLCPRCGADLKQIVRSERAAEQWLSVSLQSTGAGRMDVAVPAVLRSLSFKQTPAAKLLRGFLVQRLYRTLYDTVAEQRWPEARDILGHLRMLEGQNETLRRFDEMIGQLSVTSSANSSSD
ncbi:hypothetical protein A1353_22425 [Methylomonas methanica]|uniref:Uncharacterized protein n=1 Tax=Methylomonas methanica TaxID=421 RepID=A0A177LWF2_METMH|nr:hypothetical protein [Methylomonas methanica]OAH97826.1 hypothetical protein A1353_22425 [Methylomonas methanica]